MSTAMEITNNLTSFYFTVTAGQSATLGMGCVYSAGVSTVETAGAGADDVIGIFMETAVAGARVKVALFSPVVRALVGTGGATAGKKAVLVADGFADAPAHDSDGATNDEIYGIFMQTGIATNRVGMMLAPSNRGS